MSNKNIVAKSSKLIKIWQSEGWEYIWSTQMNGKYSAGQFLDDNSHPNQISLEHEHICLNALINSMINGHKYREQLRPKWLKDFLFWMDCTIIYKLTGFHPGMSYRNKSKILKYWTKFRRGI